MDTPFSTIEAARSLCFANIRPLLPPGAGLELSLVEKTVGAEPIYQWELTILAPTRQIGGQVIAVMMPVVSLIDAAVPVAVVHVRGAIVLSATVALLRQLWPDKCGPVDGARDRLGVGG